MNQEEKALEVVRLYTKEDKTCSQISRELSIQRKNVYLILERFNVSLKEHKKENCKICNKHIANNSKGRTKCGTCSTNIRRYKIKKKAVEYKGGCCKKCNWTGDISGFDFHHLNPNEKDFEINGKNIAGMKWEIVKLELDKCDLLCALCHRLEHSNYKNPIFLNEAEK